MSDTKVKQFGWKRKIGAQVSRSAASAFEEDAKEELDPSVENGDVDWLTAVPTKKKFIIGLEDGPAKSNRLVQEGTVLASSERYWEALKKWDEALMYTPQDEKIHEMKAQAFMELCEVYPAVRSAKKAVEMAPTWWIAHQTLGRAFLGLGEVGMAVQSFSRAVHLNPGDEELWKDDLMWAHELFQKRRKIENEKKLQMQLLNDEKKGGGVKIVEIDPEEDDGDSTEPCCSAAVVDVYKHEHDQSKESSTSTKTVLIFGKLPENYIQMRDYIPP